MNNIHFSHHLKDDNFSTQKSQCQQNRTLLSKNKEPFLNCKRRQKIKGTCSEKDFYKKRKFDNFMPHSYAYVTITAFFHTD